MAWERRAETNRRYYYESRRTADGRVVKVYFGCGKQAKAAAAQAVHAKARRDADRRAVLEEQARLAGADADTEQLAEAAVLIFEATLLVAGFRRRNFGPWRKRRGQKEGA
jgi:hypothetical protein